PTCASGVAFPSYCSRARRDLHSFPTRRSSDLGRLERGEVWVARKARVPRHRVDRIAPQVDDVRAGTADVQHVQWRGARARENAEDRKSTRLNSSHSQISYAVFCLKKKTRYTRQ